MLPRNPLEIYNFTEKTVKYDLITIIQKQSAYPCKPELKAQLMGVNFWNYV